MEFCYHGSRIICPIRNLLWNLLQFIKADLYKLVYADDEFHLYF